MIFRLIYVLSHILYVPVVAAFVIFTFAIMLPLGTIKYIITGYNFNEFSDFCFKPLDFSIKIFESFFNCIK